jgi:hypothetical protein
VQVMRSRLAFARRDLEDAARQTDLLAEAEAVLQIFGGAWHIMMGLVRREPDRLRRSISDRAGGRVNVAVADIAASGLAVLAGDQSALPAMGTLLDAIPASVPVRVYAEVSGPAEHLEWNRPNTEVAWLDRDGDGPPDGALLETALAQAKPPAGNGHVWLACEATVMRRIRRRLLEDWRLAPSAIVTRGYWKQGEVNYRDGDYGED